MLSTPTRTLAACALAAGALAAAAGCTGSGGGSGGSSGGTGGGRSQPGTSAASGAPASGSAGAAESGGGSYADSGAVVDALKSAGHACSPVAGSAAASLKAPGLRSATSCSIAGTGGTGGGTVITATVFDDHTDAQAYADVLTSAQSSGLLIGGSDQRAVLGQNWVVLVSADTAYAQLVSAALGGALVGPSSSSG
jgi:hypothetical protein